MNTAPAAALDKRDWIAGLEKGLSVIEAFDDANPRLTPSQAGERCGLTRSAARRHLLTLAHLGYVASDGKLYWLTPRVLRLGQSYLESARLPRIVQPFLQLLVTGLVCFAPAVFLAVWLRVNPLAYLSPAGTLDPVKGIAVLATLLAGAAYFPMAVLAVAMFDRVFALSPTVIIPAIVRVPLEYLTVLVIMAVILGIKVAGQYAATLLVIPFLPTFLASSLGIYFLIVQMRLLGLMYYAKRDKLGWFSR